MAFTVEDIDDLIKLLNAEQWSLDELKAVVEEAHRRDRKVAAHAFSEGEIRQGLAAGVDDFQHLRTQTPEYPADLMASIRTRAASSRPLYWTVTVGGNGQLNAAYLASNPEYLEDPGNFIGMPPAMEDEVRKAIAARIGGPGRGAGAGRGGGRGGPPQPQAEINALMVRLAREGKRVVRLKGGDPFIFGRGGEEVEHLRAAGVQVEVINGITAGLAAATSLGVPLTHRNHAHGVIFLTGHAQKGAESLDWKSLAAAARDARLTLVIYMGVSSAARIQSELLSGLPAETPVAIVQRASQPDQRHAVTTLGELAATVTRESLASPSVIVVGDVVRGVAVAGQAVDRQRVA